MGSVSSIEELRSDPERLLNGGGRHLGPERELLDSLRTVTVPVGAKGLVWNALSLQVVGATTLGSAASSSWATTLWRGTLNALAGTKAVVTVPVVMAALGVGAGAFHYRHGNTSDQKANRASAAQASANSDADPTVSDPDLGAVEATPAEASDLAPSTPPARGNSPAPVRDHLREESLLLAKARAELRSGNARAAQAILTQMQTKFPRGALSQEREVLVIESLAARGNAAAAERSARVFVATHPESPHAVQMRRFLEQHPEARQN
jgi:hypothetical protein